MTKYYKVLLHGRSCHGGDCEYALPVQREDGTWDPGEWMPEIEEPLVLCANGYHLTREPARWWREGAECYEAEWDGERVSDGDDGDKIAVRRCRLLRRLTAAELASLQIFTDGRHVVTGRFAVAYGSARVEAYDSATVTTVWGQPTVTVEERAVWIDRRKVTPVIHVIDGELVHEEA